MKKNKNKTVEVPISWLKGLLRYVDRVIEEDIAFPYDNENVRWFGSYNALIGFIKSAEYFINKDEKNEEET